MNAKAYFAAFTSSTKAVVAATAAFSALAGAAAGATIAWKRASVVFAERADKEIAHARDLYRVMYKRGEYSTPESMVEGLEVKEAQLAYKQYVREYTDSNGEVQGASLGPFKVGETEKIQEAVNIFMTETVIPEGIHWYDVPFNMEQERTLRTYEKPYIVTQDEYFEGDPRWTQTQLTYYEEDDTLVDQDEEIVDDVEGMVGRANLERFGYGNGDPLVLYVRNERLGEELEIVLVHGSYLREVAGLMQDDEG